LVGAIDQRVVAMGALRRLTSARAAITRRRVHPAFQRRGYGRRVLHELERAAKRLSYRSLVLDTTVEQTAAQALYRAEGLPRDWTGLNARQMRDFECRQHLLDFIRRAVDCLIAREDQIGTRLFVGRLVPPDLSARGSHGRHGSSPAARSSSSRLRVPP
jgi:ribosomal protein S18 acetylase RimI-like enzyme